MSLCAGDPTGVHWFGPRNGNRFYKCRRCSLIIDQGFGDWKIRVRAWQRPNEDGTPRSTDDTLRKHIDTLTRFFMNNARWIRACEAARAAARL